jgi:carbon monoxide dehydrogenase subunit G
MPEVQYATRIAASRDEIWNFVSDMDNWAPFMIGYQSHEVIDDRHSVWTLKGDVGVLARVVQLRVTITEWAGPERVSFELEGVNERVEGAGTFTMDAAGAPVAPASRPGLWTRFVRFLYRLTSRAPAPAAGRRAAPAEGAGLRLHLRIAAGGAMGPVMDAMIEPMLEPMAQGLTDQVAERVEARGAPVT